MAERAERGRVVTGERTGSSPTFNWTDEEKALLRRTLRVRVLEEDRIEIEAREPRLLPYRLLGLAIILFISYLLASTEMPPGDLSTESLALLSPIFALFIVGCLVPTRLRSKESISMFPGTAWCVRHRANRKDLERLLPRPPDAPAFYRRTRVILETDVKKVHLNIRFLAPCTNKHYCRKILAARTVGAAPAPEQPPTVVAKLADPVALQLPRVFYSALLRYVDVESLTSDVLTVRSNRSGHLALAVVTIFNLVGILAAGIYPAVAWTPYRPISTGIACAPTIWQLCEAFAPMILGIAEGALLAYLARQSRRALITISKHVPHVVLKDRFGEMRLPAKECAFVARGEVIWGDDYPPLVKDFFPAEGEVLDDDERGRASLVLFFRHQSRNLARWELEPMHRGSDLERKALESNLSEYLHFAERLPENRLQDRR